MSLSVRQSAEALIRFIDDSPTPFHAARGIEEILGASFTALREEDEWKLEPGGRYVVTRNGSALIAFVNGSKPPELAGFKVVGAHTDSPCLRLKPKPVFESYGYMMLAVEPYGGLLLTSWMNRELGLAGRVIFRGPDGKLVSKLIDIREPLAVMAQLAKHLFREVNEKGLVLDKQKHTSLIMGLVDSSKSAEERFKELILGAAFGSGSKYEIERMELSLFDLASPCIAGLDGEFIIAPRLDNLASCHAAALALKSATTPEATCVIALYDNEEVGSVSAHGAHSPFLRDVLRRIAGAGFDRAVARSLCISADMAHSVHPNYADKYDLRHAPVIGKGPVLKWNCEQRYATTGPTGAFFAGLCRSAGKPYQEFVTHSGILCGTTIGPITAANFGIRTVDVGCALLSMHSVREMSGMWDHHAMIEVLKQFFKDESVVPMLE